MKLAFCWEHNQAKEIYPNWRDGLRAALENIEKKHEVDWLLNEKPKKEYNWILTWCDSNSIYSRFQTGQYKAKRAIILTTNPTNHHNLQGFDVVFCESSEIYNECRMRGLHSVKAFGTDDKFFTPDESVKKDLEYFYPATFSTWKLQSDIAHLGNRLTCVGTVQPDGQGELEACKKAGVNIEIGYFPVEKIRDYYRRAKQVIIPAIHGSERTVLEAMSCNTWPMVTNDKNRRTKTYLGEFLTWGLGRGMKTRDFIIEKYSAKKYAEDICKSLL